MAKVHFYYSAMNAGKSTTLVQSSHNYRERGMETLVFTPEIDTRLGKNAVTSRIGLSVEAICFDTSLNFFVYTEQALENNPHIRCLLIDEAQFLSKEQVWQLSDVADLLNIPVLTYGLRSDFMGNPFEGSTHLLAIADQLIEIKTICHCGKKATMNMRVDGYGNKVVEGEQVEIGGNDRYASTCRHHYKLGISQKTLKVKPKTAELV